MRGKRKARLPVGQPDALIAVEEENISEAVAAYVAQRPGLFTAEHSREWIEDRFLHRLQTNDEVLDAALMVELADNGHPVADHALRRFIQAAMEADQFQRLPVSIRDFARRIVGRPPLDGYPSRSPQVIEHYLRDAAIVMLMRRVTARWPAVPLLNSAGRRSAAALVGPPFGVSERQARRIFQAGRSRRFAKFMLSRPCGPVSNGPGHKDSGRG